MRGVKSILLGVLLFLYCGDIFNLVGTSPPPQRQAATQESLDFPDQKPSRHGGINSGNVVKIYYCSSCSYRGTAIKMKEILDSAFYGFDVILANYPPPLPKRVLSKMLPAIQIGFVGIVMAGEQIFPMLGFTVPPPWYFSLRANRFGSIATCLLLGNAFQPVLQNTGAFEVYLNDELVFSKLKEKRFPGEFELESLINQKLDPSQTWGS